MSKRAARSMHEEGGVTRVADAAERGADARADELSRQLLSWGHLWAGRPAGSEMGGKHRLARERLATWLERCIGRRTGGLLTSRAEDLSLATSTPLLTAFLGRRATRELSRQVLRDL